MRGNEHNSYQAYLRDLCQGNGISLNKYPSLTAYMHYMASCEAIERDPLLSEMDSLQTVSQDALVQTSEQRLLARSPAMPRC